MYQGCLSHSVLIWRGNFSNKNIAKAPVRLQQHGFKTQHQSLIKGTRLSKEIHLQFIRTSESKAMLNV